MKVSVPTSSLTLLHRQSVQGPTNPAPDPPEDEFSPSEQDGPGWKLAFPAAGALGGLATGVFFGAQGGLRGVLAATPVVVGCAALGATLVALGDAHNEETSIMAPIKGGAIGAAVGSVALVAGALGGLRGAAIVGGGLAALGLVGGSYLVN